MASKEYSELLKDPRWQKRKAEIMMRDNYTCQCCGCTSKTLHVHHKYYDGRKPWEYEDDALITLCEDCHSRAHGVTIPKFGEVYVRDTGEFNEYMICYGVNKFFVYLLGMNEGAGFYSIYLYSVNIDKFKKDYKHCAGFWNNLGKDEGYYAEILTNMLSEVYQYGSLVKSDYSYYVENFKYPDDKVISYAKSKVWSITETNEKLCSFFRDVIC